MKSAITELEIALQTMETNEPINRNEGKTEQADLEAKNASEIRQGSPCSVPPMLARSGPLRRRDALFAQRLR